MLQLPLIEGLDPAPVPGDDLERVYTPDSLSLTVVHALDDGTFSRPKRVVEGHVGGGAWVRAVRKVWGARLTVLAIDLDPGAQGLQRDDVTPLHADFLSQASMEAIREFEPDVIVGNPPFDQAREHLEELEAWEVRTRIAWVLPIDLWSNQTWAATLARVPPAVVRPITRRVWPCVRGVAVWEWWPGHRPTTVQPLHW